MRQRMLAIETLCPDVNDDHLIESRFESSVRELNWTCEMLKIGFADHYLLSSNTGATHGEEAPRPRPSPRHRPGANRVETELCRMSAIGRPLWWTASRKIDSGRRTRNWTLAGGVLHPWEKAPCLLERPCRSGEEDPIPGLSPRGGGEASAGGG